MRNVWRLLPSVVLYAACLPLDGFGSRGGGDWPGFFILIMGVFPIASTPANLTWLANPLIFGAWAMIWLAEKTIAVAIGGIAVMAAAAFLFMETVVTSTGGEPSLITRLGTGYWLWLTSAAAACLGAFFCRAPLLRAKVTS